MVRTGRSVWVRYVKTRWARRGALRLGMPTTDNSNSILTFNRHSGNYNSQIGFSSNSNMYYRSFSNVAINSTQAWRKVYDSGNFTDNSANWNTAYGWGNHASGNYIAKGSEVASGAVWTTATRFGSVGQLSQGAGNHALSVRSENGNDAFMSFHIGGDYAVHFGLDGTSNRLHVGGWSDGTGTHLIGFFINIYFE